MTGRGEGTEMEATYSIVGLGFRGWDKLSIGREDGHPHLWLVTTGMK